jgi:hypothetical protein
LQSFFTLLFLVFVFAVKKSGDEESDDGEKDKKAGKEGESGDDDEGSGSRRLSKKGRRKCSQRCRLKYIVACHIVVLVVT